MTTSSTAFAAACDRLSALAEFPLSAFNIEIKRTPADLSFSGEPEVEYSLVQPSSSGPTTIKIRACGRVVKSSIISTIMRVPGWEGISHMAAATVDGEWTARVMEVGMLTNRGEFSPVPHLSGVEHTSPSNKVATKTGVAIANVAQRLISRLSRVDLL